MSSAEMSPANGLDLDDRQRAMLQEMGVKVWLPKTSAAQDLQAVGVPAVGPEVPSIAIAQPVQGSAAPQTPVAEKILAAFVIKPRAPAALQNLYNGQLGWLELQKAVHDCRACSLCDGRKQAVFGVGQATTEEAQAPRVDWLIVGEAPGEQEDQVGEPFVGPAGQLLDNMLKAMQLNRRHNVYIANVIKCRPPHNRNPADDEIAQCSPFLHRQIALLQPKIIVAMGRFAVNTLLQSTVADVQKLPLGKLRGQVHRYVHEGRDIPVIASYHPAYLLRNLPEKAKSWADLCLALETYRSL